MKHVTRAAGFCLIFFSFLLPFTAAAQTHTAKTASISVKCKGYYEYLPTGYDPLGSTTYPMLVFLTGIGEFGNGSTQLSRVLKNGPPQLIEAGLFPTSFTAGGQTHRFIVITPQFTSVSTPITAAHVDTVIQYMLARYKINPNRVYLTGISYGGGLSFAHPGNWNTTYRNRIAATVPVATPLPDPGGYDTIYARSRRIAAGNVPVWATHNSGDSPDSASRTIRYVDNINLAPAPNPLAKKTIFNVGGHDAWTKTYDPDYRENGYNVYEWMLLHQKGSAPPSYSNALPTANAGTAKTVTLPSTVTLTGSGTDPDGSISTYSWRKVSGPMEGVIANPTAASTTVTGLARGGIYTFRLTVGDAKSAKDTNDVKVTVNPAPGTKIIQVNVYGGASAYSSTAWNNWSVGTTTATNVTSAALKYVDGAASVVTATLSNTSAITDNGSSYATNAVTMAPAGVLRHASRHTAARTLTLNNLSPTKTYKLEFYGSYKTTSTSSNNTVFTINGTPATIDVRNNTTKAAIFNSIAPNASGQITVSIGNTATYNYLNGFTIIENSGAPVIKHVKTNVYGGTNPYANVEWNDWNVGTTSATNKASAALKYSDGTTSTVSATLSATSGVSDNGATYGGTMAPPEVLRYTSWSGSSTPRTLTLSGLSGTKTYSLELYASRNNTGNSTIYTIGGTSVTVVSDNNKTNKAVFNNLVANGSGQIVVTIGKTGSFNYLNGFILTESSGSGTLTRSNGVVLEPVDETGISTAAVRAFPNPVSNVIQLHVQNSYKGPVQVQVADAGGRVYQTWRFEKVNMLMQQRLPAAGLPKGLYFMTVRMGATQQTVPVSKLR